MTGTASWWAAKLSPSPAPRVDLPAPNFRPQQVSPVKQEPVTVENFMHRSGEWTGGVATRTETEPCPECRGDHYFSGRSTGGSASRCMDCGYMGSRPQQGLPR